MQKITSREAARQPLFSTQLLSAYTLLAQKQKLLTQAIGETKEKLETLKLAAQQANEQLQNGEISKEQYDALQREIIETEEQLKKLESQASKVNQVLM